MRLNCQRSDAEVAGHFSLCGLLLRLRNLYKWEHGLPPWREEDAAPMLEWVSQREDLWLELLGQEPQGLSLDGQSLDPFDSQAVNARLRPRGLVYGAGRVGGLLPAFFLGRLEDSYTLEGMQVWQVGQELGRDILFLPGLRQDEHIYLRREPLGYLLWDKLADPRPSQARFVRQGLEGYGLELRQVLAQPSWELLEPVMQGEMRAVAWHELGEAAAGEEAAELLLWALSQHPLSEVEHFARGVKDLLADTGPQGRLAHIIAARAKGALGFYPAWLAGFPRLLFPEIDPAVLDFATSGDWEDIEQARLAGWQRAREALDRLAPFRGARGPEDQLREQLRAQVIEPLTGRHQRRPAQS
ncbi:MAG: hypothetical protein V1806_13805 [Pseudomonadota bacterium]